jgi:hypothetical protein
MEGKMRDPTMNMANLLAADPSVDRLAAAKKMQQQRRAQAADAYIKAHQPKKSHSQFTKKRHSLRRHNLYTFFCRRFGAVIVALVGQHALRAALSSHSAAKRLAIRLMADSNLRELKELEYEYRK